LSSRSGCGAAAYASWGRAACLASCCFAKRPTVRNVASMLTGPEFRSEYSAPAEAFTKSCTLGIAAAKRASLLSICSHGIHHIFKKGLEKKQKRDWFQPRKEIFERKPKLRGSRWGGEGGGRHDKRLTPLLIAVETLAGACCLHGAGASTRRRSGSRPDLRNRNPSGLPRLEVDLGP